MGGSLVYFSGIAKHTIIVTAIRVAVIDKMKYEVYKELSITDDYSIFDFLSVGRFGVGYILKEALRKEQDYTEWRWV